MWGKFMDKKLVRIGNSILENGFAETLATSNYNRNELLAILDILRFERKIPQSKRCQISKIIREFCFSAVFQDLSIGVLSDTHIRFNKTNWDYIYRCYDEFAKRNIQTVLHLGDFYEGYYLYRQSHASKLYYQDICMNQLKEFEEYYPTGFTTYVCLGNHDAQFSEVSIDLLNFMMRTRKDVIPLGYGISYVKWGKQTILMKHPVKNKKLFVPPVINTHMQLIGHSHFFTYDLIKQKIKIPTCSDNHPNQCTDGNSQPGFLILEKSDDHLMLERYVFSDDSGSRVLKM